MLGIGWTLDSMNFMGGMLRMLFPFSMGLFLSRIFRPRKVKGAFWVGTALLAVLVHVPYIASSGNICLNGVFESVCILFVFPAIVWLAASGTTTDRYSSSICRFLGDISYPLYIVHYPVMYLFYDWLIRNSRYTLSDALLPSIAVMVLNIALAYAALRLFDQPLRRWLTRQA